MFPQLVEAGIEIESKFSYRKGKSSMSPTLSCGKLVPATDLSVATISRGVTFDGLKQHSAQIGTCVPALALSRGALDPAWAPAIHQRAGKWRNEDKSPGSRGRRGRLTASGKVIWVDLEASRGQHRHVMHRKTNLSLQCGPQGGWGGMNGEIGTDIHTLPHIT